MTQTFETAREVSEYLLDRTGRALLDRDVDAFLECFIVPHEIETFEGRRLIKTREDLRRVTLAVLSHYDSIGLTDLVRHCVEASFQDEKTVLATHETRLVSGSYLLREPFPALSVLRLTEDGWKIASCSYAIKDHKDHNAALMCAGEVVRPLKGLS